ncbi:hypothetical protein ACTHQY_15065 [Rhodococcoides corynebacterioides]|uniref:hypothetical protein n=1 Tax=Rhodococcoides corynebacterioides TaxID=53972 RepID=UPI003F81DD67
MSAPTHIFRSTHPDLVQALQRRSSDLDSFHDDCEAFAAKHPIAGAVRKPEARIRPFDGYRWLLGLSIADGDDTKYRRRAADMPNLGWKCDRKHGAWVPDRRTDEGKLLAAALPRVPGSANIAETVAGMPTWITVSRNEREGTSMAGCASISLHNGVVTAACPGDPHERREPTEQFQQFWRPVKLSDYYAEQGL